MKLAKAFSLLCVVIFTAACMPINAAAADEDDIAIDETNFPSEIFREYINENYDTDKNGMLSAKEIENAEYLSLPEPGTNADGSLITPQLDMTGISYLKKLKDINIISYNAINADLSGIEALINISFSGGSVKGLVFGDMTALEDIYIYNSDITNLSLNYCPELMQCTFNNNSNLKILEIKNAAGLRYINCQENALVSLKIDNCKTLWDINCSDNKLTRLSITSCPMLSTLNCSGNKLAVVDISQFDNIIRQLKIYDGPDDQRPPLTIDSSTKIIGYDMAKEENQEDGEIEVESAASGEPQEKGNNKAMLVMILAAIVVAAIAAAVIIVMVNGDKDDQ